MCPGLTILVALNCSLSVSFLLSRREPNRGEEIAETYSLCYDISKLFLVSYHDIFDWCSQTALDILIPCRGGTKPGSADKPCVPWLITWNLTQTIWKKIIWRSRAILWPVLHLWSALPLSAPWRLRVILSTGFMLSDIDQDLPWLDMYWE